jgi:hypothetical protein
MAFSLIAVSGGYSVAVAQASYCDGFSCCRAWALDVWASVVAAHGLSTCSSQTLELAGFNSCGAWTSAAPWHVASSQTRDQTCVPCIGRQTPIHFEKVFVYFISGCTRASSAGGGGLLIAEACCRARPPRRMRIRSCAHGLSRLGTQVSLLCGMWHLPRPGIKLMSPGLQGRFLTPGPPREAPIYFLI